MNGASADKMIVRPACVDTSARTTLGKSLRSPRSVFMTKKLGRLNRNVAKSRNGTFTAEYITCQIRGPVIPP